MQKNFWVSFVSPEATCATNSCAVTIVSVLAIVSGVDMTWNYALLRPEQPTS